MPVRLERDLPDIEPAEILDVKAYFLELGWFEADADPLFETAAAVLKL